jgi:hypothetical protein
MNEIYIEKRKSKNEKPYICMYCELGYKQMMISFNDGDIAQLLGVSVKSLYDMDYDTPKLACKLNVVLEA